MSLTEYSVNFATTDSSPVKVRVDVAVGNRGLADFCPRAAAAIFSFGEIAALDFTRLVSCGFFTATFFDVRLARRAAVELSKISDLFVSACPEGDGGARAVIVECLEGSVSLDFIASTLGKIGEIEKFSFQGEKVLVEFYDTRAPLNAVRLFNPRAQPKAEVAEAAKVPKRQAQPLNPNGESFYQVNSEAVRSHMDGRTTCMIRNIPNKYTQKMLLKMVDAHFAETFDFFYLPVDFKNKCNVGYAFVNFVDCQTIPFFMENFDNKRWERFNSDKVCKVTYARLQGKDMLIDHFKSSSIMQQHKNLRPFFKTSETTPSAPPGFSGVDAVLMDALENWSDTSSCMRMFDSPEFQTWEDGGSVKSWLMGTPEQRDVLASILGPPPGLQGLMRTDVTGA